MIVLLIFTIFGFGSLVCFKLDDIKIELKYRNTLLKEQNETLKQNITIT